MECCNCGAPASHRHHIVPRSVGGTDRPSNLAPVCEACHSLIHGRGFVDHKRLSIEGQARARAAGKQIGRRKSFKPEQVQMAQFLKGQGKSVREIAKAIGLTKSVVGRLLTEPTAGESLVG
jgi:DNA-binding NarL/FixJ family response regulator